MKRNLGFIAIFLFCVLVLSACSQKSTSLVLDSQTKAAITSKTNTSRNGRVPDFGQPEKQADIRGVVITMVGNEVTVLKIAVNQNRRSSSTSETGNLETNNEASSSGQNTPAISLTGANNHAGGARPGGQDMPGGFGGGQGREAETTDRAAMIANLKTMSTGQEKIIIPVGIKMMKLETDSTGKRITIEASLADISADKMITVWLNSAVSDKKVADFVLIN